MSNINIVYYKKMPKLEKAYLICGFPGSGYVGKLAIDHMIQELDAELIADIYSDSLPPQVIIKQDGTLELMKISLYYSSKDDKHLLLLTADSQPIMPDAEYALADNIFEMLKIDIEIVFTLAAYITGVFVNKPKVYAAATDKELVDQLKDKGLEIMDNGTITGMNGIILGLAKLRGIKGICLLGETSGYVVDANASQTVLKALLNIINVEMSMEDLEKRAKEIEAITKALEQQMQQSEMQQQRPKDLGYIS